MKWTKERGLTWVSYLSYTEAERSILARLGIVLLRGGNLDKTIVPPTAVTFYDTAEIFNQEFWEWLDAVGKDPPEDLIDGFFRRLIDTYCKEMGIPNPSTMIAVSPTQSPTQSTESDTTNDEIEGGCNG